MILMKVDVGNTIDIIREYANALFAGKNEEFNTKNTTERIKEINWVDNALDALSNLDDCTTVYCHETKYVSDGNCDYHIGNFTFGGDSMLVFKCDSKSKWEPIETPSVESTTEQQAGIYNGTKEIKVIKIENDSNTYKLSALLCDDWVILDSEIFEEHTVLVLKKSK